MEEMMPPKREPGWILEIVRQKIEESKLTDRQISDRSNREGVVWISPTTVHAVRKGRSDMTTAKLEVLLDALMLDLTIG